MLAGGCFAADPPPWPSAKVLTEDSTVNHQAFDLINMVLQSLLFCSFSLLVLSNFWIIWLFGVQMAMVDSPTSDHVSQLINPVA